MSGIFKGLYRGCGIYWYGRYGYGDETRAYCRTLAEYKARIDASIEDEKAKYLANRTPAQAWWDDLPDDQRRATRMQFSRQPDGVQNEYDSVSSWGYAQLQRAEE